MVTQPPMELSPEILSIVQTLQEVESSDTPVRSVFWVGFVGGSAAVFGISYYLHQRKTKKNQK